MHTLKVCFALAALALAAFPADAHARHRRRGCHGTPPAGAPVTLHGEALLDPSLGDRDIDVCLESAVQDVSQAYAAFAEDCRDGGGTPSSSPAELGTNLVTFNEVTQLCTLDVQASCAASSYPGGRSLRK